MFTLELASPQRLSNFSRTSTASAACFHATSRLTESNPASLVDRSCRPSDFVDASRSKCTRLTQTGLSVRGTKLEPLEEHLIPAQEAHVRQRALRTSLLPRVIVQHRRTLPCYTLLPRTSLTPLDAQPCANDSNGDAIGAEDTPIFTDRTQNAKSPLQGRQISLPTFASPNGQICTGSV